MKNLRILAFFCAIFLAAPVFAQSIKVNWKQGASFSGYKTYAWKITPQEAKSIYVRWGGGAVTPALAAEGWCLGAGGAKAGLFGALPVAREEMIDATTPTD